MTFNLLKKINNKLFSDSVIYGLSGTFVAVIPLFLLPFMTRSLSQSEYGLALFFSSIITIVLPIIGFGSINAISVRYFQLEKKVFSSYLWSCICVLFLSIFTILLIFLLIMPFAKDISIIPFKWIFIGVLTASFWGISQACGILLIAKKSPHKYFFINATIGIITVTLTILLIKYFGFSWQGFGLALFLGHFTAALLSLYILNNENKITVIKKDYCKDSLSFGIPVMIHSIAMSLISYFDRIIISNYLDIEELARYGVAFQLAIILSFIAQAFNKAFVPWLYENLKKDDESSKYKIVRGTYLIFIIISLSTIFFSFSLEFLILQIAGQQYLDITNIAIIIAIGAAFNAAYLMVVNYIFYAGKTIHLSIVSISVAIFFVALSSFMVPRFGIEGAALSYTFANFLLFISIWYLAASSFSMPWFSRKVFYV